ncbi:putative DNA-binding transcriptional regulator YafY [Lentzea atacamensis]|uniref:Putative DNA-binding transcriptional regulator YafY n=1 Tax=Lentzea atacamensis TaxID=531938 RepID=A0A316I428_9PSEU|nr:YafY family protein [Lentzea atacamensis]PWK87414.1 putative DNA-binding transcriptional regulator YafY [Lentzea atacamensis]
MVETSARLLKLLSLLQTPRDWSGPELAERLGVTTRTVRNDVDRLRSLGYPVHATPGVAGGYKLGAGAKLPPLLLDDDEAVAIALSLSTQDSETADRALRKLEQVLPSRLRHRVAALQEFTVGTATELDPEVTVQIVNACRARERLRFDYVKFDGARDRREVEPYRLVHTRGRWYLVAWDVARQDWRTFRADRMQPRIPTGPRFTPRELPDLEAHLAQGLATAAWRFRATVTVHAPAHEVAARVPAALVEAVDETTCRMTAGSDTPQMLAVYLGMLDSDFEVDGPPELVQHLGKTADRFRGAINTADHG